MGKGDLSDVLGCASKSDLEVASRSDYVEMACQGLWIGEQVGRVLAESWR